MAAKYEAGATVYELAIDFACNHSTVAARLKKAGVEMRLQPTNEGLELITQAYLSGLSLLGVGKRLGFSQNTVHAHLKRFGIQMRDTHGRI